MAQNAIKLHDYQETAKNFLIKTPKAGLFLDVGFGKTLTTLCALKELAEKNMIHGHILIIAPKPIARSTWIDEMIKWGINANTVSLIVNKNGKDLTKQKRLELYEEIEKHAPAFYFINRDKIVDLVNWHIDNNKPWPFPTVVIDELQSFKSHKSERFKALKKVSKYITRFIGLTGTPIPNGIEDLWSEVYLMDEGKRLGKTITSYRQNYFIPGLTVNNIVVGWTPKEGAEEEIYNKVNDIVLSVKNPNLKLPQVTYNNMYCYMDAKEQKLYKTLIREQALDLTDKSGNDITVSVANAAVLSAKLMQMASGTLYVDSDKTTNKKSTCPDYITVHQHKLEQLEYIINNTNSPVLVAYHFKSDKQEIINYLTKKNIPVQVFDGSPEMIHEWNKGKYQVMIMQPSSTGQGVNIQDGGHTLVWYTVPTSLEEYIQTNGRLYRQGQKYPVVIHHLLTAKTIDDKLLKNINKKDTTEKALIDAIAQTITNEI